MDASPKNKFDPSHLPAPFRERSPKIGLVLGSGLGGFVDEIEVLEAVSYHDIPGLPTSKVPGHAGQFLFGRLGNLEVLVAQGRVHLYEGHTGKDVTAGVRCMAAAGISQLVLTNAAGSANPNFTPGEWMALTDHLNLTGTTPLLGGANFIDMSEVYSKTLRAQFASSAKTLNIPLHEGVYAGLLGPQYETPAEVRMLRTLGADAVGMSTVLEAIQARALGIEVAGFSCLTNWGAGMGQDNLNHDEVMETGKAAASQLVAILRNALGNL